MLQFLQDPTVPIIPVDEYSNPQAPERHVGPSEHRLYILAVAQAHTMKMASEQSLSKRIG
jgi:hypothetical protein